jgi:hypothetical protein
MINPDVYAIIDYIAFYNVVWISILFVITLCRLFSANANAKLEKYDGNLSESAALPFTLLHNVCFVYAIYTYDYLSALLFAYWGPGFLLTAYWYLHIKKHKIKFNWAPYGLITSYLCKLQYVIYMFIYSYFGMYDVVYLFSIWIMHDQIHLIWFHTNADRLRRVTEDWWILRIGYPLGLIVVPFYTISVIKSTYLFILGVLILIGWAISLYKIIKDNNFHKRPANLEYLRNIVYLSSRYRKL